jgi:hypothetical protein
VTFFFDNNMSRPLVHFIRDLGADVCHLQDHFSADVKDVSWIPWVGERQYVVVTCDERLRKNEVERIAIIQHKVAVLLLPNRFSRLLAWDQAEWLVPHWRKIEREAQKEVRWGTFYKVTDNGKIEAMK